MARDPAPFLDGARRWPRRAQPRTSRQKPRTSATRDREWLWRTVPPARERTERPRLRPLVFTKSVTQPRLALLDRLPCPRRGRAVAAIALAALGSGCGLHGAIASKRPADVVALFHG